MSTKRKLSKNSRIDLVLNTYDFTLLNDLKTTYETSAQHIVEAALTHLLAIDIDLQPLTNYNNEHRVPIRVDGLLRKQLEQITNSGVSQRDALRYALQIYGRLMLVKQ